MVVQYVDCWVARRHGRFKVRRRRQQRALYLACGALGCPMGNHHRTCAVRHNNHWPLDGGQSAVDGIDAGSAAQFVVLERGDRLGRELLESLTDLAQRNAVSEADLEAGRWSLMAAAGAGDSSAEHELERARAALQQRLVLEAQAQKTIA